MPEFPKCSRFVAGPAVAVLLGLTIAAGSARAADGEALVDSRTRLAVTGDSITEQKQYSRFMELYLLVCAPERPEAIGQWGWSGDRAPGFANRMRHDLLFFKPTLITTCYGMNDGNYRAYEDNIGKVYRDGMEKILEQAKEAGATVLVGGPGAVDPAKFRPNPGAEVYNANLAKLSGIARELADEFGFPFADVHEACMEAMRKSKAALGDDYVVMGNDGFHPGDNGHMAMAYAFLKGMNLPGDIGEIAVELTGGEPRATAAGPHEISVRDGKVVVTSRRWPFCFTGGGDKDQSTRSIQPYLPFNDELNRFILKAAVPAGVEEIDVKWGEKTRTFTTKELADGVNLAAAFAGETPFQTAWAKLENAVAGKQNFETWWIKNVRSPMREVASRSDQDPAVIEAADRYWETLLPLFAKQSAAVLEAVVPVEHSIEVIPLTAELVAERAAAKERAVAERERWAAEHKRLLTVPGIDLEAEGWRVVYDFDINSAGASPQYSRDESAKAGEFTRVAYQLELVDKENRKTWITVELDAFGADAAKLGLPTVANGATFQQAAKNLLVRSNSPAVAVGEHAEGWLEIWPNNYSEGNAKGVPGASGTAYDWGDTITTPVDGYGSLQIHLPSERQVLFALNNWKAGKDGLDIGIGNSPAGHPDHTFARTGANYPAKRLLVLVK